MKILSPNELRKELEPKKCWFCREYIRGEADYVNTPDLPNPCHPTCKKAAELEEVATDFLPNFETI